MRSRNPVGHGEPGRGEDQLNASEGVDPLVDQGDEGQRGEGYER